MKLVIICGPTASGKSELAVALAEKIGGEVINADSMQLYRGMDIGTAKITEEDRHGIPHHLLDILDVNEDASVASYQALARKSIAEISARGKYPILVGGTGLYIKSTVDEMNFPETDQSVRGSLEAEAETYGTAALYQRLSELDPLAAEKIEQANTRRIIRALEVIAITGEAYSAQLPKDESSLYPDALHIGLQIDRSELAPRIEARTEKMFTRGLVGEVESLIPKGLLLGTTAQRAIGYSQTLRHLAGEITFDAAVEETKTATRQYVRRQETWFKRDNRIQWIPTDANPLDKVIAKIES